MTRPPFEVADVIRTAGGRFREHNSLTWPQCKVLDAIARCRTAALGGHRDQCSNCGHQAISYNSCRNRHCPKCQTNARDQWLAKRQQELLPVDYYHLVFSVPHALVPLMWQNKRHLFALLFEASADTLLEVAADPRHLGAQAGLLSILHTWGQTLQPHPHIHCVVPGSTHSGYLQALISFCPSRFSAVSSAASLSPDCEALFATANSCSTVSAWRWPRRRTLLPFWARSFSRTGSSMPSRPSADRNMCCTIWPVTLIASPSLTIDCSRLQIIRSLSAGRTMPTAASCAP
jgi:hypothetical protein